MATIRSGYRVTKAGKIQKTQPRLDASAKRRQASSKRVRVKRGAR